MNPHRSGASRLLKASVGIFTTLCASGKVVHYTKKWPRNARLEMEVGEIVRLRLIRCDGATGDGTAPYTVALHLAGLIANMFASGTPHGTPIIQVGAQLSPELEAIKYLLHGSELVLRQGQMRCCIGEDWILPAWHTLHQDIELSEYGRVASAVVSQRLDGLLGLGQVPTLVLLNAFRAGSTLVEEFLDWLARPETGKAITTILAFRCATDSKAITVTNVLQETFRLPVLADVQRLLSEAGWAIAFRVFPELDRDYLLPFNGNSALCVMAVSGARETLAALRGMTSYEPDRSEYNKLAQDRVSDSINFDVTLSSELSPLKYLPEPDWQTWCSELDWDPATVDWKV